MLDRNEMPRLLRALPLILGKRTLVTMGCAVVASLTLAGVELAISLLLQLFLKSIGLLGPDIRTPLDGRVPSAAILAAGLVCIALVRSIAQFVVSHSGYVAMESINARIRRMAIWEMLLHPMSPVVAASSVNARVGDLAAKSSLFCYYASNLVSLGVQSLALVPIMFVTARWECTVALTGLGIVGLFVLRVTRLIRRATRTMPDELNRLTQGIQRVARNFLLVRVLRTNRLEHWKLTGSVDNYRDLLIRAGALGNLANVIPPFAGILLILVVIAISQGMVHTSGMTLLAFLYLFIRFVMTFSGAVSSATSGAAVWPAFRNSAEFFSGFGAEDIVNAMSREQEIPSIASRIGETSPPTIEVSAVGFCYPGTNAEVLRGVSVTVEAGTQLAIVGSSGSGKSTLMALILGLADPTKGSVAIDGLSPAVYFASSATRVGYVGADPFLIAGTISDNLRYGLVMQATDEDLLESLDHASLGAFVRSLPDGLAYRIAEDGAGLSAGQKQRLCLARALLNRPHVLVLDEATANLDVKTETEIAESLRDLRGICTTILVSHRAGIMAYADQTVTLHPVHVDGRVEDRAPANFRSDC